MPRFVFALPWWIGLPLLLLWLLGMLLLIAVGLVWVTMVAVWEAISHG